MGRIKGKYEIRQLLFVLWLGIALLAPLFLLGVNDWNLINSDDSSELILAEMLSHKNFFLTRGWIYSTELRVVNTQIVRAVLFWFTDNWTLVRILGNLILSLWLLASYGFFVCQLNVDRKWFWYTAPFLLTPFSYESFYVMGLMGYYIPHIAFSFLILGCWLYLYRQKKYAKIVHWILVLCSFAACLGGIRQIEMTFLPMVMAIFFLILEHSNEIGSLRVFLKKTYYLWTGLLGSLAGYLVNTQVLSKWFFFKDYEALYLRQFTMERAQIVLRYFLNAVGYTEDVLNTEVEVFSLQGILFLLSWCFLFLLVLITVILWKRRRKLLPESRFLLWFSLAGLFLNAFLFLFTDTPVSPRYFVLNLVMYVPLLIVFYRESGLSWEARRLLFAITAVLVCVLGGWQYQRCLQSDANEARREYTSFLLESDYVFGYATFWNANVLTELTEGKVEMVALNCSEEGEVSLNPWLAKLENVYPPEPREHAFLLLSRHELRRFERVIGGREPIFEDGNYYIYLYQDSDEFLDIINRNEEG